MFEISLDVGQLDIDNRIPRGNGSMIVNDFLTKLVRNMCQRSFEFFQTYPWDYNLRYNERSLYALIAASLKDTRTLSRFV